MGVGGWIVIAIVVVGVVIALFGWDRYRGNRKRGQNGGAFPADQRGVHRPDDGPADASVVQLQDRRAGVPRRLTCSLQR